MGKHNKPKTCNEPGATYGEAGVASVGAEPPPGGTQARSAAIASRGINTAGDAANFLSALIGDVMTGGVKERTANSASNAMGKLLKVVDMQHRYGRADGGVPADLKLADPTDARRQAAEVRRTELLRELAELEASGGAV